MLKMKRILFLAVLLMMLPCVSFSQGIGQTTGYAMLASFQAFAGGNVPYYNDISAEYELNRQHERIRNAGLEYEEEFQPIYLQDAMNRPETQSFRLDHKLPIGEGEY